MLGRGNDNDSVDDPASQELSGQSQGECRLTGTRGRGSEKIARPFAYSVGSIHGKVLIQRLGLPRTEPLRCSPRCALGIRRRKVFRSKAAEVRFRTGGGVLCVRFGGRSELWRGRGCARIFLVHATPDTEFDASSSTQSGDESRVSTISDPSDKAPGTLECGHTKEDLVEDRETHRASVADNPGPHPWRRLVSLGDSFTEGIGDPLPEGGHRGWADRVAEVLGAAVPDFAYANLAVRGKLIRQISDTQIEPALALSPDLITFSAGGNDVIRPGSDPDQVASLFEDAVIRLSSQGALIVVFTGIDTQFTPVFRGIRGKVAIFNENVRAIADRHDCIVADQWALKEVQDMRFFDDDRLHFNSLGHHEIARMVLRTLNVPNELQPMQPDPLPVRTWREAAAGEIGWAREHLVPWVIRRLRHQSSGDNITAKRPEPLPVITLAPGATTPAQDARGNRA